MKIVEMAIIGVKMLQVSRHTDERGWLAETWSRPALRSAGIAVEFVQANTVYSRLPGTLRGLHYQSPPAAQGKLVQVIRGAVYDVAVDIRKGSPSYGRYAGVQLNGEEGWQLWIPPGFAHGYLTLEPDTQVLYYLTAPYAPKNERGVRWDDPVLAITWPQISGLVISDRDRSLPYFTDLPQDFSYGRAT